MQKNCSTQKNYNTKTGQAIQHFIEMHENQQFAVGDVVDYMDERGINVNLTTVYRNLDRMVEQNRLAKYKTACSDTYQYRIVRADGGCHSHLHMNCRICGKILHMDGETMKRIVDSLSEEYGFVLECENSMLGGVCRECAAAAKK